MKLVERLNSPQRVNNLQMERPLGLLLFTGLFSAYIDRLGPVVLLNVAGVIYMAVGLWVISRVATLRWMTPWVAQT